MITTEQLRHLTGALTRSDEQYLTLKRAVGYDVDNTPALAKMREALLDAVAWIEGLPSHACGGLWLSEAKCAGSGAERCAS